MEHVWMADGQDPTPWLQVDLGSVHNIKRTDAYFVMPTAGHAYRVESSIDGAHWKVYQVPQPLVVESPHTAQAAVSARYLRIYVMKGTPGLWEFHVWE